MKASQALSAKLTAGLTRGAERVLRNRRLMRMPILLYRARLGFLLGSRFVLVEHTGRKSGLRRQVLLEVFGHPAPGSYIVVSGFGGKAQWFRNVQADPRVRISVGRRTSTPATARLLAGAEADDALHAYAARHPRAWETFKPVIESTLGRPIRDRDTELPLIAFDIDG
ncbi:nitroreductase family deazaflavin-dependent oxidoreductase [Spelaeicoccus albus]|uniref:Deazaflavin-dependent oxidoreductase (Nitroreductase family) n=1 Tax=Spelaeicoccus albus TaxID=1280376 RepID=A0A7Z0D2A6_9MICO|nr:nitroreductase family deazaflavin-dependent oxidoreductase [Spelaeicoccus albus]NYI67556.1 deazaflavin-dependent oxidoreductase (nitroreductase family) [Spelaeicoccus albus]